MQHLPDSDHSAGIIEVASLGESLERAASRRPDAEALVFPTQRTTYSQLNERVAVLARSFLALDVAPGDKIAVLLPQCLDNLASFFAIAKIGAVAVPVNSRFKAMEIRHVLGDAEVRVFITNNSAIDAKALYEIVPELAHGSETTLHTTSLPSLRRIVDLGAADSPWPWAISGTEFEAMSGGVSATEFAHRRYAVRVRDVATIIYTSGTTGFPKGAMLTHEALVREGLMVARTRLRLDEQDRVWSVLPFFHIGGVVFASACIAATATYVHAGDFRPGDAVRQLAEERCTVVLAGFETIWLPVLTHVDFDPAKLPAIRLVFCLGIPERMHDMQGYLPDAPLVSAYGSTETCSFIALADPDDPVDVRMNTSGRVLPGLEMKAVDPDTGMEVRPGEVGELCCRGWSRFEGYYNDPEQTVPAIDADGWFHSGDLGTVDERGLVTWTSRLKDMMKVGGENVAALEIEGFLVDHPAVHMAQVVSAPDAYYTEVPTAFIVLSPGQEASEQEIIDYCRGRVASFKVPRYVRFVDEWPMSGTKIQKFVLRERIALELASQGITEAPRLAASRRT